MSESLRTIVVLRPELCIYGVMFGWYSVSFFGFDLPFIINKSDINKSKYYVQRSVGYYHGVGKNSYFEQYETILGIALFGILGYRAYQTKHIGDVLNISSMIVQLCVTIYVSSPHLQRLEEGVSDNKYLPQYGNDDNTQILNALTFMAKNHMLSMVSVGYWVGLSLWSANTSKPFIYYSK